MILQQLSQYHHLQVCAGHPDYAPLGMELKRVHFVLVLTRDGMLLDIERREGKTWVAASRPRGGKDAPLIANRMWDSVGYVAGYGSTEKLRAAALLQYRSFVAEVNTLHRTHPGNETFAAVADFYSRHFDRLSKYPLWPEIISKPGHNLSFRLMGEERLASQQLEIISPETTPLRGLCMVTGRRTSLASVHPKVYVHGGSPTGAKLVSFTKNSGYDSYHKKGGENAPVSVEIAERYSSALTGLLQQDSGNNIIVGELTFVFFTLPDTDFSPLFRTLADPSIKADRHTLVSELSRFSSSEAEFILLALVPNVARVSVRLHLHSTVGEVCRNILLFYEEMCMGQDDDFREVPPLLLPLFIASPGKDIKRLPSRLMVDYLYAVLTHHPFPVLLQYELLNRRREAKTDTPAMVRMLRCYLNRNSETKNNIPMSLDKKNRNAGYLLGRLFAILERTQEIAHPGITFTLRDTYYTVASVTPSAVFNRLIGLSSTFFRRIPKQGTAVYLKSQLGEVTELLCGDSIPSRLSPDDQSRFALGYFHQRQTYFTKHRIDEQDC